MKFLIKEYQVKDFLWLIPLGDLHFGSKDCNEEIIKKHIDWIKQQDNAIVILMGDIINAGTKASVGAGNYDDSYNPQEQYEKALDLLKPIQKKIIGVIQGNHEERIRELSSFDISKMMAKDLCTHSCGYGALLKIKVNNINYHIYAIHGSTFSSSIDGKMRCCKKMQENVDAEIYIHAHTHSLSYTTQPYYRINNKSKSIEVCERHFILTGNFVNWDGSYGEKKNYSLLPIGIPKIKLFGALSRGSKKIQIIFSDR